MAVYGPLVYILLKLSSCLGWFCMLDPAFWFSSFLRSRCSRMRKHQLLKLSVRVSESSRFDMVRNDEVNGWIIHDGYSIDPYCIATHCNIVTQCHAVSCQWCQHLKFYKSLSLFSVVWDFGVHPHDSNVPWTLDYEGMKATWKDKLMWQTLGEWCWVRVQELFLPNVLMFWRHSTRNRNVCKRTSLNLNHSCYIGPAIAIRSFSTGEARLRFPWTNCWARRSLRKFCGLHVFPKHFLRSIST